MTFVIAEPCLGVCDTACVDVCPANCINGPKRKEDRGDDAKSADSREGLMLYINPEECVDCALCVPECPEDAIFEEDDLPEKWKNYIEINEKFFGS